MFFVSMWLQARGVNLSCVRSCVVIAEERPRLALTHSFSKLFKDLGLSMRAVSTAFGSRVNLAICLQVDYLKFELCKLIFLCNMCIRPSVSVIWCAADLYVCGFVFFTGYNWTRPLNCVCGHEVPPTWPVRERQTYIKHTKQIRLTY